MDEEEPFNPDDVIMPSKETVELFAELEKILKTYLWQDPVIATPHLQKAVELKRKIERAGFMVCWEATVDPENPSRPKIKVTLGLPKKNMSPEDRAAYNAWFAKVNDLPLP